MLTPAGTLLEAELAVRTQPVGATAEVFFAPGVTGSYAGTTTGGVTFDHVAPPSVVKSKPPDVTSQPSLSSAKLSRETDVACAFATVPLVAVFLPLATFVNVTLAPPPDAVTRPEFTIADGIGSPWYVSGI